MLFLQAIRWILDPEHWTEVNFGPGIGEELLNHLWLTFISVLVTVVVALPVGLFIGHTGRGRRGAVLVANVVRAFPTLGVLSLLTIVLGLGIAPNVIVFVLLGIPPVLAGAYAGLESIDRRTIDAARAVGMSEWQILGRVELPLAAPLLLGGLRSTTLQIVASVTLVSNFGTNTLGDFILGGLASNDPVQIVAGSLLVTGLALLVDAVLAVVERLVRPRGTTAGRRRPTARRRPLTTPTGVPIS